MEYYSGKNYAASRTKKNISNTYGAQGIKWLAALPKVIQTLSLHWQLHDLQPVSNMSYNYVAFAIQAGKSRVILKISCDSESIAAERQALLDFAGIGAIKVIDHHPTYNALLLESALPGTTLKTQHPKNIEFVMQQFVDCVQKLHVPRLRIYNHQHISVWLQAIDKAFSSAQLPVALLQHAITLKRKLLPDIAQPILLHGDLHLDNILQHENTWLAIDPKGVLGCLEFEMAAFDFISTVEIEKNNFKSLYLERIANLAAIAKLDLNLFKEWVYVRLMLSAAWSVEDNGDASKSIELAQALYAI